MHPNCRNPSSRDQAAWRATKNQELVVVLLGKGNARLLQERSVHRFSWRESESNAPKWADGTNGPKRVVWKPSMHSATAQAVLRSQVRWHDQSNISKVWLAPNGPRVVWEPFMDSVAEQAVVRSQVHIVDVAVPCPRGMSTRSIGAGLRKPVFHLKGSATPASFKLTTHHLSLGVAMHFLGASGLGQFPQK